MLKSQKRTIIYFLGNITVSALGFIVAILYSNLFLPEDYAVYTLTFQTYSLVSAAYGGWISVSILRNAEKSYRDKTDDVFFGSILQFHIIMSLVFFLAVNLILLLANMEYAYRIQYAILSLVYFFEYFILIGNTKLRTQGMARQYSTNMVLNNVGKIVILLLVYYIFGIHSTVAIIVTLLLTELLQTVYLLTNLKLGQYFKRKLFSFAVIKRLFLYGYPLVATLIASWVLSVSDRYIIEWFYGKNDAGLYSYSYSLGNALLTVLMQSIMLGAFPDIVKGWENGGAPAAQHEVRRYLKTYFLIAIPACFGIAGVARQMYATVVGPEYYSSWPIFILTSFGIFVLGLTQYTNKAWELTNKTGAITLFTALAAVINIALNLITVPRLGYWSAAMNTIAAYVVYFVLAVILSRKVFPFTTDWKSLLRVILGSTVMLVVVLAIGRFFTEYSIFTMLITVLAGAIVYFLVLFISGEFTVEMVKNALKKILGNK